MAMLQSSTGNWTYSKLRSLDMKTLAKITLTFYALALLAALSSFTYADSSGAGFFIAGLGGYHIEFAAPTEAGFYN